MQRHGTSARSPRGCGRSALRRLILAAGLLLLTAGDVQAADTGTIGGSGGSPQRYTCPPGALLAGVRGRLGAALDHIEPLCVAANARGQWLGTPTAVLPGMGSSSGGQPFNQLCPRDSFISWFMGRVFVDLRPQKYGRFVGGLKLSCRHPATGQLTASIELTSSYDAYCGAKPCGEGIRKYELALGQGCDDTSIANGIHGKSGVLVDQFGLSCQPLPLVALCQDYARKAVAQVKEAQQMNCAFTGPRWTADAGNHLGWCMGLSNAQGPTQAETAARAKELQSCRITASILKPKSSASTQALGTSRIGQEQGSAAGSALQSLGSAGGSAAVGTTPRIAALSPAARYDNPLGAGGLPLYACTAVGGADCGQPVALAFCQRQDYPGVADFAIDNRKTRAETLSGEVCTKKRCKVFTHISCR